MRPRASRYCLRRPTPLMLALALALALSQWSAHAQVVLPTGAHATGGIASINTVGSTMTVTTNANRSIVNWQTFSIGSGATVAIQQPGATSANLNRVVGSGGAIDPSLILGTLQSNGRVFLINPSGIVFGAGSQVDVAGLVASSLNLSNADFLGGRLRFTEMPGAGAVVNQGTINAATGGEVYLVGPSVTNSGIITSPKGEVILAAGTSVELVNPGTPNLRVEITAPGNEARNLGQIVADSGRIGIYAGLINHSGTIRADTVQVGRNGEIWLRSSKNITLERGSVISASGSPGGVHDGGSVRVVAEEALDMRRGSTIRAAGGGDGGDGGFIELSGRQRLKFEGRVGLEAPKGRPGTLLLDPMDLIVGNGGSSPLAPNDQFGENPSGVSFIDADAITAVTNTGAAVVLEANNDLTISEAIVTDNPNGDGGDITLRAGRSVLINAAIVTDNGDFTAIANETTANGVVSSQRLPGRAEIRFNGPEARVDAGSGTATFTNSELLGEIRTDWAFTIGASLPHIHVTAASATFSAYSVPNMRTRVDTLTLAGVSGSTVFNEGNLVLKLLTTSGSFMDMRTTGMLQLGAPVSMQANGIFLIGNGVTIDQNITTGGLLYLDGGAGGLNIKGVSAIARSVQLLGASINIGDVNGSTPTLVAGNFIGAAPLGHLTLQGGAASGASATLSSPGGIHLTPGGDLRVRGGSAPDAKAVVFGGDGVHMTVGGLVKIDAGAGSGAYARIEAALPGSMLLEFPTTAPAGYSIKGIEGVVTSGASGFFATGRPAVPPQDLLITYGSATPFRFRGGVSLSPFLPSIEEVTSRMPLRNVMTRAPDALTRASDALTTELERVRLVPEFLFPDPGERSRDREGR